MKQLQSICLLLSLFTFYSGKAQNLPFMVGEINSFKELILNGNKPTGMNFTCEYEIDEQKTQWGETPTKERISIMQNASMKILHGTAYTECKLQYITKLMSTYTQNNNGESFLVYHGDTATYRAIFNLSIVNEGGQDIHSEICNQAKYDYEGFNCFCHRFIGKNVRHLESCMASENFPAVNSIFNLYYGFDKPTYFPVNFSLTIDGKNIFFKLKSINFEALDLKEMPHMDDFTDCREISFQEFYLATPELR
ncbi:MAG: hypothetical protein ORN56_07665 [Chitinophagales bacterium]|nr:hypothetical protein [Chitinophagales bacterium]